MEAEFVSNLLHFTHRRKMKHPTATAHRIIEAFWCRTCVPGGGAGVSRIVLIWQYVANAFETLALF